ncbi:MAG: type II toxin-antitoxin system RelE/ParE family toxin [Muribaculaceae bacterium]|nr:type II toxin-antitoxin system RelE/ParE family toxin [Muribaculaceae bacterium]
MDGPKKFKVIISEEVDKFLDEVNPKAKAKIFYNINLVAAGLINKELFKKIEGTDIWEFRTLFAGIAYRLLSFFDTDEQALIITTHGFIKKTQKTPLKEIEKAKIIRTEYFNQK